MYSSVRSQSIFIAMTFVDGKTRVKIAEDGQSDLLGGRGWRN